MRGSSCPNATHPGKGLSGAVHTPRPSREGEARTSCALLTLVRNCPSGTITFHVLYCLHSRGSPIACRTCASGLASRPRPATGTSRDKLWGRGGGAQSNSALTPMGPAIARPNGQLLPRPRCTACSAPAGLHHNHSLRQGRRGCAGDQAGLCCSRRCFMLLCRPAVSTSVGINAQPSCE